MKVGDTVKVKESPATTTFSGMIGQVVAKLNKPRYLKHGLQVTFHGGNQRFWFDADELETIWEKVEGAE